MNGEFPYFGDVSQPLLATTGLLARNHPDVGTDLPATRKPLWRSDDQYICQCRQCAPHQDVSSTATPYNQHFRLLSPSAMVVEQPKFTRVEEPTLLCNQVAHSTYLEGYAVYQACGFIPVAPHCRELKCSVLPQNFGALAKDSQLLNAVTGQSGNPEKDRSRYLATQGASFRMTDLVNCSAFADSLDLTATAGAGFAGLIFDAIQSAIDIGVARYDLNVLARLRERN